MLFLFIYLFNGFSSASHVFRLFGINGGVVYIFSVGLSFAQFLCKYLCCENIFRVFLYSFLLLVLLVLFMLLLKVSYTMVYCLPRVVKLFMPFIVNYCMKYHYTWAGHYAKMFYYSYCTRK